MTSQDRGVGVPARSLFCHDMSSYQQIGCLVVRLPRYSIFSSHLYVRLVAGQSCPELVNADGYVCSELGLLWFRIFPSPCVMTLLLCCAGSHCTP